MKVYLDPALGIMTLRKEREWGLITNDGRRMDEMMRQGKAKEVGLPTLHTQYSTIGV